MSFIPVLARQVWLLAFGRLLSQVGTGFTLFYAPIFFVNQVGLSATSVGLGIGSAALSGMVGRAIGGSFTDSPRWGRRRTLLLSAGINAIGSFTLAAAYNFPTFVLGNLLVGLGTGIYWPATEAVVADLTTPDQRSEAYSVTRLADSLGLGMGVIAGGLLISATGLYRLLFIIDGISFVIFWGVIYWIIAETDHAFGSHSQLEGWRIALRDRRLLTYAIVNILFTLYIVQVDSTLPLYFSNFVRADANQGFTPATISALYTAYLTLTVLAQLPVARSLNRLRRPRVLMLSALCWSLGFALIWRTGTATQGVLGWAIAALSLLAMALVTYLPSASALVVDLAPDSLRGVYLGVNSQCWALGYLIGPPLGGWALDQPRAIADGFWLFLVLSVAIALIILRGLDTMMVREAYQRLRSNPEKV
jgi:MFS family permease